MTDTPAIGMEAHQRITELEGQIERAARLEERLLTRITSVEESTTEGWSDYDEEQKQVVNEIRDLLGYEPLHDTESTVITLTIDFDPNERTEEGLRRYIIEELENLDGVVEVG